MEYNFKEIESKWQNVWYTQNTFAAKQDFSLPKYHCPCCNELISRICNCCYKCGQALDWSEQNG